MNIRFQYNKGFTLVELLIVFVMISIISSMGVVISVNFNQNQVINTAVQDIHSMLFSARSQTQSVISVPCNGAQFSGINVTFCNSTDQNGTNCSTAACINNNNPDYQMDLICGGSYKSTLQTKFLPNKNIKINPSYCSIQFQPFNQSIIATGSGVISISGYNKTKIIIVQNNGVIQ